MVLLFIFTLTYHFVIAPYRKFKWYVKTLTNLGYRVLDTGYSPLGVQMAKQMYHDSKKYGNKFHKYQHEYFKYDVAVMNIVNKIYLEFIKPELIQEMFSAENIYTYHKDPKIITGTLVKIMGKTIGFVEGEVWKKRRIMFSKVFSNEFLQSNIPSMIEITSKKFLQFEKTELFP